MNYRDLIKAQLKGFNKYTPIKEGDYAMLLDAPEKSFRERDVVHIKKVVGEFCFVNKFNRSKSGWVHTNNLEKIKMVIGSDENDDASKTPIAIDQVTTLKDLDPRLFAYFGKRIKSIFSKEMIDTQDGISLPNINPKIAIGEFLSGMEGVEGFICPHGSDAGTIFVNSKAHFPVDEVVSHEFSHILAYYSHALAEKLKDPSIQLGVTDDETDLKKQEEEHEKNVKEWQHLGLDDQEIKKIQTENYYLKPAEIFAHTEQMRYLIHKFKNIDIQHINLEDSMTDEEKQRAIQEIQARPMNFYKRKVMNKLVSYTADKYNIKDFTIKKIYESLFDNIEQYIPPAIKK